MRLKTKIPHKNRKRSQNKRSNNLPKNTPSKTKNHNKQTL